MRVKATIGGKTVWQMRDISGGGGGQDEMRPNFGLGDATLAETIRIEWPSGTVQEVNNVAARQILTITEPPKLAAGGFAGGEFRLRLLGATGLRYRVETSTNLRDWTAWMTFANTNRLIELTNREVFKVANRFYRLVQEAP